MRSLIIDNDDSFTANLEHLVAQYSGLVPETISYHSLSLDNLPEFDLCLISPGPGKPGDYPLYHDFLSLQRPTIGICLGMQIINEFCGGEVRPLPGCIHGRTDEIMMRGRTFTVARYHSLSISRLGEGLDIIATNQQSIPMAIRHRTLPFIGYQFHPESFMTPQSRFFIEYAIDAVTKRYD